MDPNTFIDDKLTNIMQIISNDKNKKVFLAGDFNFDPLKYSQHSKIPQIFMTK